MKPRARSALNVIPAVPAEWCQSDGVTPIYQMPHRRSIALDAEYAYMSLRTFMLLSRRDWGRPTGVYPGKMWKCITDHIWLAWIAEHPTDPNLCAFQSRLVVIL